MTRQPSGLRREREAAAFELSLSVKEAYAAIPHRRTPFDFEAARLSAADRAYLDSAFPERVVARQVELGKVRRDVGAAGAFEVRLRACSSPSRD